MAMFSFLVPRKFRGQNEMCELRQEVAELKEVIQEGVSLLMAAKAEDDARCAAHAEAAAVEAAAEATSESASAPEVRKKR